MVKMQNLKKFRTYLGQQTKTASNYVGLKPFSLSRLCGERDLNPHAR